VVSAVEQALTQDQRLWMSCHEALHDTGKRVYANITMILDHVRDPTMTICDSGLLHGLLGAYVTREPSGSHLEDILNVCRSLSTPTLRGACGDSVGHALWESTPDFYTAALRCGEPGPESASCVGGVFMQMYFPVAPTDRDATPRLSQNDVQQLCLQAPSKLVDSCAEAAHYVLSARLGLAVKVVAVWPDGPEGVERFVLPVLLEGLTFCAGFPGRGAEACQSALVSYTVKLFRPLPAGTLTDDFCRALPTDSLASFCETSRAGS
jgi:hypothetical protein